MANCQSKKGARGNGGEIFLDTQGACFLCLKDPSSGGECEGEKGLKGVSLRDISRYLEIGGLKRRSFERDGGGLSQEVYEQYEFEVDLCEGCGGHVNQLSGFIRVLEETKVGIKRELEQFQGILKGCEEREECRLQWRKILEKNPVENRLLEYLREETGQKCAEKLKILTAAGTTPPTRTNYSSERASSSASRIETETGQGTSSGLRATSEWSSTWTPPPAASTDDTPMSPPSDLDSIFESSPLTKKRKGKRSSNTVFEKNYRSHQENGASYCHCLHCDFSSKSDASKIRMHILTNHPEVLFTKIPRLSESEFEKCVEELLDTEVKNGIRRRSKTCWHCEICKCIFQDGRSYKYHLGVKHHSMLERKLKRLQEAFRSGGRRESVDIEEGGRGGARRSLYTCLVWSGGCGKTFSQIETLRNHEKVCQKGMVGGTWECTRTDGGCGKRFCSRSSLKRHQWRACEVRKAQILSGGGVSVTGCELVKSKEQVGSGTSNGSPQERSVSPAGRVPLAIAGVDGCRLQVSNSAQVEEMPREPNDPEEIMEMENVGDVTIDCWELQVCNSNDNGEEMELPSNESEVIKATPMREDLTVQCNQ